MNRLEVCLSPELIHLYDLEGKVVVIVDILRATSCMTAGIGSGVKAIHPVASLDECAELMKQGYIGAAERGGQQVEGFDIGNSPFSYMEVGTTGKKIAVTTTNGTVAITKSKTADEVIIGSFLNISAVSDYVKKADKDLIIHCAGWKGRVNLEDTLFAGALTDLLKNEFALECDSALASLAVYEEARPDMMGFLEQSSHVRRLKRLNIEKDIEFCLRKDEFAVVPVLKGDEIFKA